MEDMRLFDLSLIQGLHNLNGLKGTIKKFFKDLETFQSLSKVSGGDRTSMSIVHTGKNYPRPANCTAAVESVRSYVKN